MVGSANVGLSPEITPEAKVERARLSLGGVFAAGHSCHRERGFSIHIHHSRCFPDSMLNRENATGLTLVMGRVEHLD
jgi:hypothetical protein